MLNNYIFGNKSNIQISDPKPLKQDGYELDHTLMRLSQMHTTFHPKEESKQKL